MTERPRFHRRLARAAALVALCTLALPHAHADAGSSAVTVTQDGWWNRANDVGSRNPAPGTVSPTVPNPSVPANAISVSATPAEPGAVAAVGFILEAMPGATVQSLVLRLKEASAQNGAGAVIVACPITDFWAGAKNGSWSDRPKAECADPGAARGTRTTDGTWTFDLTRLGQSYVDGTLEPNGVLLAPATGTTAPFQVNFLDSANGGVTFAFASSGGGIAGGAVGETPVAETPSETGGGTPVVEAPLSADELPVVEDLPPPPLPGAVVAAPPRATGAREVAQPAARVGRPSDLTDIPLATLLLLPLALLAAIALAYALGPAGRPEPTARRSGGVSRALRSRAAAGVTRSS